MITDLPGLFRTRDSTSRRHARHAKRALSFQVQMSWMSQPIAIDQSLATRHQQSLRVGWIDEYDIETRIRVGAKIVHDIGLNDLGVAGREHLGVFA